MSAQMNITRKIRIIFILIAVILAGMYSVCLSYCAALPACSTRYASELEKKHELLGEIKEDAYILEVGIRKNITVIEKDEKIREYTDKKLEIMGKIRSGTSLQPTLGLSGMGTMCSAITPEKNPEFIKTQDDKTSE